MKQKKNKPVVVNQPVLINAGDKKIIREYVGIVNTKTKHISIAHMNALNGWSEPGQCPEFDEYTLVLKGLLRVEWKDGYIDVNSGQAVICHKGTWVRYSTLESTGAEYISICLPAFSPQTVNRDL